MKQFIGIVFLFLFVNSCIKESSSTRLESATLNSPSKRVAVLKKEIKAFSDFEDAEFDLFNVNGFSTSRITTIPGASSLDYKFAVKLAPSDIDKWIEGLLKVEPKTDYDMSWTAKITEKRKQDWQIESSPELYTRRGENVMLIIYRMEGILFKRVIMN